MLYATDDTIVAVSSPPGSGPRGIVRFSGPEALRIASGLFVGDGGAAVESAPGFTRVVGRVRLDQRRSMPAECYVFRAPHSYTRQDCVELHTVGSPPLLAMLVDLAVADGARPAQPGEFTARAFISGAMDLTQAEAVAAIVTARSDAELRASRRLKEGVLASQTAAAAKHLGELASLVEADIDFAEEPIVFITPEDLRRRLADVLRRLHELLDEADSTERLACPPTVLLVGVANAGKSSLMNALTGLDRAICSAVAGTTRDVLSAPLRLECGEAILLDAAGHDRDPQGVAALGVQRARAAADHADLICLVTDLTSERSSEQTWEPLPDSARAPVVVAANKVDLVDERTAARRVAAMSAAGVGPVCPVSATMGTGLADLREAMARRLAGTGAADRDRAIALTSRQRASLEACCLALERARQLAAEATETVDCADVLAVELREALDALGEVTGAVATEDLLGRIFACFCIGK